MRKITTTLALILFSLVLTSQPTLAETSGDKAIEFLRDNSPQYDTRWKRETTGEREARETIETMWAFFKYTFFIVLIWIVIGVIFKLRTEDRSGLESHKNKKGSRKEGQETLMYGNGQTKAIKRYNEAHQNHGKWTQWYASGQIMSEGSYKDGKKSGKWTFWKVNGEISSEDSYKNGKKIIKKITSKKPTKSTLGKMTKSDLVAYAEKQGIGIASHQYVTKALIIEKILKNN